MNVPVAIRPRWGARRDPARAGAAERARRAVASRIGTPPARTPTFTVLVATVAALNVVGLVMVLSASSVAALSSYGSSWHFFNRQFLWAAVGVVAFVVASRVDYRWWRTIRVPLVAGAGVLLVAVLAVGIHVDGATRWLGAGPLRFQPSEVAKLAVLVFAADLCTRRVGAMRDFRAVAAPVLVVSAALAALVVVEPDLGSSLVLGVIVLSVLAVAGLRLAHLGTIGLGATALVAVLAMAAPYRRRRVFAVLDPWADAPNAGYQISQSLIAIGSGGWDGVGLGAGRAKWLFLPNAHTDFIFAIIAEELGLIGSGLVLALFGCFAAVGIRVALRAPDRFGSLLAAGVTAWVLGQAVINLGAVTGLLPITGIALPFLSAGGSALVFTMLGAGILANIARQCPPGTPPSRRGRTRARPRRAPEPA